MTKKILIDETVVKQALEALEPLTINAELRGDNFPEGNELHRMADAGFKAITDLREALEVNNKGVNALAEQQAVEPVAWMNSKRDMSYLFGPYHEDDIPLYAHPALTQQPCGWQFFAEGKWHNGLDVNNHRANTEAAGFPVRDVFPAPTHQPLTDALLRLMQHRKTDSHSCGLLANDVVKLLAEHGITGSKT